MLCIKENCMNIPNEVIEQAQQGDIKAFEEIYKITSSFVFNCARRVVNNIEDAKEITQEVYLKVHAELKNFRNESSLKTWLYRLTVNMAINASKKKRSDMNRETRYNDTLEPAIMHEAFDVLNKEDASKQIEILLTVLSPEEKSCILLRNIEQLSYEEIANALNMNINTVRTRLKRAREKMQAMAKEQRI